MNLGESGGDKGVVHRNAQSKEEEILDQDQQQKIIDDLKSDYERMVKTQKNIFSAFISVVAVIFITAAYKTEWNIVYLGASVSYLSLILCQFYDKRTWCWIVSSSLGFAEALLTYKYHQNLHTLVLIGINVGFLLMVLFLISSRSFFQSFPDEINHLQKLKYGAKLA